MSVLPAKFYGDPAEVVDELRKARKKAEQQRINKSRRIKALVKQVMERAMR